MHANRLLSSLVALVVIGLTGCKSEGDRAAEQFGMVDDATINQIEKCAAARKASDAYLSENDEENYRAWRHKATMICLRAQAENRSR